MSIHRVVMIGIGFLFLGAAALKFHGIAFSLVSPGGWYSSPEIQLSAAFLEVLLGIWLLSGRYPVGSWIASLAVVVCFLAINLHQALLGIASCGCFGQFSVSPVSALIVDGSMLLLLLVSKPDLSLIRRDGLAFLWREFRAAVVYGAGGALLVGATLVVTTLAFGSLELGLAHLRGAKIAVIPNLVELDEGHPGDPREAEFQVRNLTDQTIRVFGGTSDCSCVATLDLPVSISPRETVRLRLSTRLPGETGQFTRLVRLLADADGFRVVQFRLTGRTTASGESNPTSFSRTH